jgi:putative FmdB family regulatory protein
MYTVFYHIIEGVMELPIYEFECTCCPSRFELRRGFHDDTPVSCPNCGGRARQRFSSVPIIFKGSGFYVTDSRGGQSFTSTNSPSTENKTGSTETAAVQTPKAANSETKASKDKAKVANTKKD